MMSTDGPALMTPTISKSEFFLKPAISSSLGAYSSNNRKGSASTITSSAFKGIDSSNLKGILSLRKLVTSVCFGPMFTLNRV